MSGLQGGQCVQCVGQRSEGAVKVHAIAELFSCLRHGSCGLKEVTL